MSDSRLVRFGLYSRALVFTVGAHAVLLALLVYSFDWEQSAERGSPLASPPAVEPVRATAVSEDEVFAELERRRKLVVSQAEAQRQATEALEQLRRQQHDEQKKLAELAKKREAEERKQQALERQSAAQKRQSEARRAAEEKEKLAAEKKRQADAKKLDAENKRQQEAEQRRLAEALREQLQAEQFAATRNAASTALSALVDRIAAKIEQRWRRPGSSGFGLTATILVKVAPDGRVLSARVTSSSGDRLFDRSAEIAVQKASPLPFPRQPEYYEFINEFNLKFDPDES